MASIFTRIIRGEIPCYKVAENDRAIAFLDIRPLTVGAHFGGSKYRSGQRI